MKGSTIRLGVKKKWTLYRFFNKSVNSGVSGHTPCSCCLRIIHSNLGHNEKPSASGSPPAFLQLLLISAWDMAEESLKVRRFLTITDDDLECIFPTHDMGDRPGEFKTQRTNHGTSVQGVLMPTHKIPFSFPVC
jgi:hypothetical protein